MSEQDKIIEALKKGKMVIVRGASESRVKVEYPKNKVEVVVRS